MSPADKRAPKFPFFAKVGFGSPDIYLVLGVSKTNKDRYTVSPVSVRGYVPFASQFDSRKSNFTPIERMRMTVMIGEQ